MGNCRIGSKAYYHEANANYNGTLQFGLLDEIIRKTGVMAPKVEYLKSVASGDEFDVYKISWL